jgi:hypothetical protein
VVKKVGAFGPYNKNGLEEVVKKFEAFGPYAQSGLEGVVKNVLKISQNV